MTQLLEKAFAQAAKLPPAQQDELAQRLILELADEQAWDKAFAGSQDALARLANEALAEHRAGLTQELHPKRL